MNDTNHIATPLQSLQTKLDAIDGVRTTLAPGPEVLVEFKGRRVGTWVPDGLTLAGQFSCAGMLLCADTPDEACRLTIGRLG